MNDTQNTSNPEVKDNITSTVEAKRDALSVVIDAANIHSESLVKSLDEYSLAEHFKGHRREYIRKLDRAIRELQTLTLTEELKVKERISDLSLEESIDLYFKLEWHIKNLRGIRY
jgi:hypothetical protein